jgi:hypothetical protein
MTVMIPEEVEAIEGTVVDSPNSYRLNRVNPPPAPAGNGTTPKNQGQSANGPSGFEIKSYHRWVMAEFIACVILVGLTPLIKAPQDAEGNDLAPEDSLFGANALIRLTAISVVFLILSLLSNNEKSGKFASAFGGLVLAGLLVNTSPDLWEKLGSLFGSNVGTGKQPTKAGQGGTGGGVSGIKQDLSSLPSDIKTAAEKALKDIIPWGWRMVWEWLTGAVIVAIVYVLVKPGSQAGAAITDIEEALAKVIQKATGNS